MKKTSNNRVCCLGTPPEFPTETNALIGLLRDLAASEPEAKILALTLRPEKDPIVEDYVRSHFGEED